MEMKHLKLLSICLLALPALRASAQPEGFSDGNWHSVLVCDGGAAVVDNALVFGRGGEGGKAQIVVRDQNIIRYFNQAGAVKSSYGATEWIGQSYPTMQAAGTIFSFQIPDQDWEVNDQGGQMGGRALGGGSVSFDGNGLYLDLGSANWYFRSCVRQ
jgi:hypothetical protein